MTTIHVQRMWRTAFATYGSILVNDTPTGLVTLELPWKNNAHMISCIPASVYAATMYPSPKRGYAVPLLAGVADRDAIEMHIGNLPQDTDGCILVGTAYGMVNGLPGIVGSRTAFHALMAMLPTDEPFSVTVTEPTDEMAVAA